MLLSSYYETRLRVWSVALFVIPIQYVYLEIWPRFSPQKKLQNWWLAPYRYYPSPLSYTVWRDWHSGSSRLRLQRWILIKISPPPALPTPNTHSAVPLMVLHPPLFQSVPNRSVKISNSVGMGIISRWGGRGWYNWRCEIMKEIIPVHKSFCEIGFS